jgi:regulator of replication initiation timing
MRVKVNATVNERPASLFGIEDEEKDEEIRNLREEVKDLRKRLETWDEVMKRNADLEIENARLRKVLEQTSDRAAKNYLKRFDEMSNVGGEKEEPESY